MESASTVSTSGLDHELKITELLKSRQRECICKQADRDEFYIQCENCNQWYHGVCVTLTQSIVDHIKHWYCDSCINVKQTVYNPNCTRFGCVDYQLTGSQYCSDNCGLTDAASKIKFQFKITRLDLKDSTRNTIQRNRVKKRLRFLERKQVFLDDCIENAQSFRISKEKGSKERQRCGFDNRFLTFPNIEVPNICEYDGKCPLHDSWELTKSQEIQFEMDTQINTYKKLKSESIKNEYETIAVKDYLTSIKSNQ